MRNVLSKADTLTAHYIIYANKFLHPRMNSHTFYRIQWSRYHPDCQSSCCA